MNSPIFYIIPTLVLVAMIGFFIALIVEKIKTYNKEKK